MNRAFQNNKITKGFFIFVKPIHHLEDQDIHYKVMNTLVKAMRQYGDVKLAIMCDHKPWSQVDNHIDINPEKDLSELNQDMKQKSLVKDSIIDTSLAINGLNVADKENLNISAEPATMIIKNTASKQEDTSDVDKLKAQNENQNKTKDQDIEEAKTAKKDLEDKELDFCNQDLNKIVKQKKSRSSGYNRWGRDKDVQLFQTLKQICSDQSINIEDFWNDDLELTEDHQKVLQDLKYQLHWGRKISTMLKRIRMLANDQSLSTRQCIVLRRLVAKARRSKTKLIVEDIAHMFPGKSISTLQSWLNDLKNKKQ